MVAQISFGAMRCYRAFHRRRVTRGFLIARVKDTHSLTLSLSLCPRCPPTIPSEKRETEKEGSDRNNRNETIFLRNYFFRLCLSVATMVSYSVDKNG